jgi:hypothetical protein
VQGRERGGDPCLHVGRAAAPELAVDHRRPERVLARVARPTLAPAARVDGVEVAEEGERRRIGLAAADTPDVGTSGRDLVDVDLVQPDRPQLGGDQPAEGQLLARHARRPHGPPEQVERRVVVDRFEDPLAKLRFKPHARLAYLSPVIMATISSPSV